MDGLLRYMRRYIKRSVYAEVAEMGLRMFYHSAICLCSLAAVLGCCLGEVPVQITIGNEDLTKIGTDAGLDVYGCICKGCRFSTAWPVQVGMH
ncbi:unnamed protein product [Musa acuminata var. zebrina]